MDLKLDNIRLLTLSEAAALLHVSTRTLQRMIRSGEFPALKVGGQWRVRESQLRQMNKICFSSLRAKLILLFSAFAQKGEYPRTRIGLAVCKKIVERRGGKGGVEAWKGATFYFTIPA